MRPSLTGPHLLPESHDDYVELLKGNALRYKYCTNCNDSHLGRTHTRQGWAETQISGWCEQCFDALTPFLEDKE